ncbi:hypothetical protein D3C84_1167990 [compost metagenome]
MEKEAQRLVIRVSDNGVGMDVGALEAKMNEPVGPSSGYALKNVRSRLQLYYGQDAEITFVSEPYIHTEVSISIPLEGGDKG